VRVVACVLVAEILRQAFDPARRLWPLIRMAGAIMAMEIGDCMTLI
jgi:hypothetical protein